MAARTHKGRLAIPADATREGQPPRDSATPSDVVVSVAAPLTRHEERALSALRIGADRFDEFRKCSYISTGATEKGGIVRKKQLGFISNGAACLWVCATGGTHPMSVHDCVDCRHPGPRMIVSMPTPFGDKVVSYPSDPSYVRKNFRRVSAAVPH